MTMTDNQDPGAIDLQPAGGTQQQAADQGGTPLGPSGKPIVTVQSTGAPVSHKDPDGSEWWYDSGTNPPTAFQVKGPGGARLPTASGRPVVTNRNSTGYIDPLTNTYTPLGGSYPVTLNPGQTNVNTQTGKTVHNPLYDPAQYQYLVQEAARQYQLSIVTAQQKWQQDRDATALKNAQQQAQNQYQTQLVGIQKAQLAAQVALQERALNQPQVIHGGDPANNWIMQPDKFAPPMPEYQKYLGEPDQKISTPDVGGGVSPMPLPDIANVNGAPATLPADTTAAPADQTAASTGDQTPVVQDTNTGDNSGASLNGSTRGDVSLGPAPAPGQIPVDTNTLDNSGASANGSTRGDVSLGNQVGTDVGVGIGWPDLSQAGNVAGNAATAVGSAAGNLGDALSGASGKSLGDLTGGAGNLGGSLTDILSGQGSPTVTPGAPQPPPDLSQGPWTGTPAGSQPMPSDSLTDPLGMQHGMPNPRPVAPPIPQSSPGGPGLTNPLSGTATPPDPSILNHLPQGDQGALPNPFGWFGLQAPAMPSLTNPFGGSATPPDPSMQNYLPGGGGGEGDTPDLDALGAGDNLGQQLQPPPGGITPPVPQDQVVGIGHQFGQQTQDETPFHKGVDYQAVQGTPAISPVAGTIVDVGDRGDLGLSVLIQDKQGQTHELNHLSAIAVQPGAKVMAGDLVGAVGSTGNSTGPHLDYRVRGQDGDFTNPMSDPTIAGSLQGKQDMSDANIGDLVGSGQDEGGDSGNMADDSGGDSGWNPGDQYNQQTDTGWQQVTVGDNGDYTTSNIDPSQYGAYGIPTGDTGGQQAAAANAGNTSATSTTGGGVDWSSILGGNPSSGNPSSITSPNGTPSFNLGTSAAPGTPGSGLTNLPFNPAYINAQTGATKDINAQTLQAQMDQLMATINSNEKMQGTGIAAQTQWLTQQIAANAALQQSQLDEDFHKAQLSATTQEELQQAQIAYQQGKDKIQQDSLYHQLDVTKQMAEESQASAERIAGTQARSNVLSTWGRAAAASPWLARLSGRTPTPGDIGSGTGYGAQSVGTQNLLQGGATPGGSYAQYVNTGQQGAPGAAPAAAPGYSGTMQGWSGATSGGGDWPVGDGAGDDAYSLQAMGSANGDRLNNPLYGQGGGNGWGGLVGRGDGDQPLGDTNDQSTRADLRKQGYYVDDSGVYAPGSGERKQSTWSGDDSSKNTADNGNRLPVLGGNPVSPSNGFTGPSSPFTMYRSSPLYSHFFGQGTPGWSSAPHPWAPGGSWNGQDPMNYTGTNPNSPQYLAGAGSAQAPSLAAFMKANPSIYKGKFGTGQGEDDGSGDMSTDSSTDTSTDTSSQDTSSWGDASTFDPYADNARQSAMQSQYGQVGSQSGGFSYGDPSSGGGGFGGMWTPSSYLAQDKARQRLAGQTGAMQPGQGGYGGFSSSDPTGAPPPNVNWQTGRYPNLGSQYSFTSDALGQAGANMPTATGPAGSPPASSMPTTSSLTPIDPGNYMQSGGGNNGTMYTGGGPGPNGWFNESTGQYQPTQPVPPTRTPPNFSGVQTQPWNPTPPSGGPVDPGNIQFDNGNPYAVQKQALQPRTATVDPNGVYDQTTGAASAGLGGQGQGAAGMPGFANNIDDLTQGGPMPTAPSLSDWEGLGPFGQAGLQYGLQTAGYDWAPYSEAMTAGWRQTGQSDPNTGMSGYGAPHVTNLGMQSMNPAQQEGLQQNAELFGTWQDYMNREQRAWQTGARPMSTVKA